MEEENQVQETPKKEKTKGIVLFAFGSRSYGYMAYNLAHSIKFYNPKIKIQLVYDPEVVNESLLHVFDYVTQIERRDMFIQGIFSAARVKCNIHNYATFDEWLYLDVDAICLKDLQPLIDKLSKKKGYYFSQVIGKGTKENENYPYNIWATHADLWDHYDLEDDAEICAIQSSIAYFKNNKSSQKFFDRIEEFDANRLPTEKLRMTWGHRRNGRDVFPDELTYNVVCASLKIDPSMDESPIHFAQRFISHPNQLSENHYLLAIYGPKGLTHQSALDYYDRSMKKVMSAFGNTHVYKSHILMKRKYANNS